MKKLLFVTGNKNKVEEAQQLLKKYEIEQLDIDLPEYQGTAEFVVKEKAKLAFEKVGRPLFVEDTSVGFHALNGFPGPFIKHLVKANEIDVVPKMLSSFEDQSATGYAMIGFIEEKDKPIVFIGKVEGKIVDSRGSNGFAWDSIFQPDGKELTFAEMTLNQKNRISHRRMAFLKFKEYLDNE